MIIDSLSKLSDYRLAIQTALPETDIIVTNGCFDLFHPGHLHLLKTAKQSSLRNPILFVLVNGDYSVRTLKGNGRPVQTESVRAEMVDSIRFVDYTYVFSGVRCHAELDILHPTIYIKGDDRKLEDLDIGEREVLEKHRTKIIFLPRLAGLSTTEKIASK